MSSSRYQARALPAFSHFPGWRPSPSISDEDDDMSDEIQSPQTGLVYRVSGLSNPDTRASVQDVFNEADPPEMYMSQCRLHNEVYAIEIKEVVSRTVRIGAPGGRYAAPVCETCVRGDARDPVVCRHVVWVMDQVASQAQGLHNWNPGSLLTMTSNGYAAEMGDPYQLLATYHLDLLAARLNCRVAPPAGESRVQIDYVRIGKIRKMLRSLTGSSHLEAPWESSLDSEGGVARSGDVAGTLFRMLYSDDTFYGYFCRQMEALDHASDRFHRLQGLADHVFALFERRARTPLNPPESTINVAWAAMHINSIVRELGMTLQRSDPDRLGPYERQASAEALAHILRQVIANYSELQDENTSLCHALIGSSHDCEIIIGQLAGLSTELALSVDNPEASHKQCCDLGGPDSYVARIDAVINKLRNARS